MSAIGRCFKYLFVAVLACLCLVVVWICVGSIDADSYEDYGMEADYQAFISKKAESDGMKHMPFFRDRQFSILKNNTDRYALKTYLSNLRWDKSRVEAFRELGRDKLPAALKSLEEKYYVISGTNYADLRSAFSFQGAEDLFLLLLLESQWQYYEEQSIENAYKYLLAAMKVNVRFAELIEEGFIGLSIASYKRSLVYPWFSYLCQHLDEGKLKDFQIQLLQWNQRYEVALELAYTGDFMGGKRYMESDLMQKSVLNRPSFPKDGGPGWVPVTWEKKKLYLWDLFYELITADYNEDERIRLFLMDYFPRYFYHKNRGLGRYATHLDKRRVSVLNLCKDKTVENLSSTKELIKEYKERQRIPWYTNDMGRYDSLELSEEHLGQYHYAECMFRQWSQVFAARLGIAMYQREHNDIPETLEQLYPVYLSELPQDSFNGEYLGYSKENAWLYSSGSNFQDDAGSADALVNNLGQCYEQPCKSNPTYPLYIKQPYPLWPGPESGGRGYQWEAHGKL